MAELDGDVHGGWDGVGEALESVERVVGDVRAELQKDGAEFAAEALHDVEEGGPVAAGDAVVERERASCVLPGSLPSVRQAPRQWSVAIEKGLDWTVAYDANGNMVSRIGNATSETMAFEWDAGDRLVAVERDDGVTIARSEFTYDGFSRRVRIEEYSAESGTQDWSADGDRRFVWDGLAIAGELTGAGAPVAWFFAQGELRPGTPPETRLYLRDHLGSVRTVIDDEGAPTARYDYDPYGRRTRTAGTDNVDFGFTGHFTHAGTGLVLAPFRAYDADLGRWISRDPIGEAGGVNIYGYVAGSPTMHVDTMGLQATIIGGTPFQVGLVSKEPVGL
jgi:RHS repeat-associated protein